MKDSFEKLTLPNGVRIVYEKMPQVRSVSMGILTGVGSRMEKAQENGASHFIEHMVFKGTQSRTAQDLAFQMDAIGGQTNAFTTKECTCFHGRVLNTHLDRLSDILCDMYFNARFSESDVRNERGVISEEIDMYNDTPDDLVAERLFTAVFAGSPLARPILGKKATLDKMTGESLRRFMQSHYVPSAVVVALAGDITAGGVEDIAARFEQMPARPAQQMKPAAYTPAFTVKKKSIEQNHLCIGFPGLSVSDDRRYAFQLMSSILGGGMSSRLFQKVREENGLCYSIYTFGSSYIDTGIFCIYTALSKDTEKDALELICGELRRFLDDGVTQEELSMAREQVKANVLMSLESTGSRMHRLAKNELYLDGVPDIDSVIEAYDRVTAEEVLELARTFLDKGRLSFSAVGRTADAETYRQLLERNL